MTKRRYVFAVLIALALVANIPHGSMAQNTQSSQVPAAQDYAAGQQGQIASQPLAPPGSVNQSQPGGGGGQAPQPQGGVATVVGVDQPENCLRIRSGPGGYYDVIGCANIGDQLNITGVWTSNDWAQLADNGWVYGPQIETDLRPPRTAYSSSPSYVVSEAVTPVYDDWGYLPNYGYNTYWYGGIPLFLYNVGVWNRFHPWWWNRGHHAWWWKDGHHGKRAWNQNQFNNFVRSGDRGRFNNFVRGGGRGGAITNRANISSFNRAGVQRGAITRSNISSSNVNRFNTNRFRSGSTNAFRSQTFSSPNRIRSGSMNTFRSQSFSSPSRIRSQSFSSPSTFRSGSFGGRQFSGASRSGGFSSARIGGGGGGVRMGGAGGGHMGGGGGRRR